MDKFTDSPRISCRVRMSDVKGEVGDGIWMC